jgi:hypothetical protein
MAERWRRVSLPFRLFNWNTRFWRFAEGRGTKTCTMATANALICLAFGTWFH